MTSESLREEYPLHWAVWHNDFVELQKALDLNIVSTVKLSSYQYYEIF